MRKRSFRKINIPGPQGPTGPMGAMGSVELKINKEKNNFVSISGIIINLDKIEYIIDEKLGGYKKVMFSSGKSLYLIKADYELLIKYIASEKNNENT